MTTPVYTFTKEDIQIIKAAWATDAGKHALRLIIERISGIHGDSPTLDHAALAFTSGRRFVGRTLTDAINLPIDKLIQEQHEPGPNRILTATERADLAASGRGRVKRRPDATGL